MVRKEEYTSIGTNQFLEDGEVRDFAREEAASRSVPRMARKKKQA